MVRLSATTVSARLLLPFVRVCGADPRAITVLGESGLQLAEIVHPDARLSHALAMRALARLVEVLGDPLLGLKAGGAVAAGDLELLEQVANSHSTLRAAADLITRYLGVVHGGAAFSLTESDGTAMWRYRVIDGVLEPSVAHDFAVSAVSTYVRLYTGRDEPKLSVHFAHGDRRNLDEYRRLFRCPVMFNMEYTGIVFPAERLDWTFSKPSPVLSAAFEARAREKLDELTSRQAISSLVRQALSCSMESGDVSMPSVARRLGTTESSLRRRLAAEGTTHTEILNEVRKELALSLLQRPDVYACEVARSVGFADPTIFSRAFKRWTGTTPAAYRRRSGLPPDPTL
jgi:AraC-like DNA-binding protein